jgi:hypothetical protein
LYTLDRTSIIGIKIFPIFLNSSIIFDILEIIPITQLLGSKFRLLRGKTGINQTKGGESVFLELGCLAVRGVQTRH